MVTATTKRRTTATKPTAAEVKLKPKAAKPRVHKVAKQPEETLHTNEAIEGTASEVPTPVQPRAATLAELVAAIANSNGQTAMAIVKREDNNMSLHSAGELSIPEAIVMISVMAAGIYSRMSVENQQQLPINAFLNQIGNVTTRRIVESCPNAPVYYPMVNTNGPESK